MGELRVGAYQLEIQRPEFQVETEERLAASGVQYHCGNLVAVLGLSVRNTQVWGVRHQ